MSSIGIQDGDRDVVVVSIALGSRHGFSEVLSMPNGAEKRFMKLFGEADWDPGGGTVLCSRSVSNP